MVKMTPRCHIQSIGNSKLQPLTTKRLVDWKVGNVQDITGTMVGGTKGQYRLPAIGSCR